MRIVLTALLLGATSIAALAADLPSRRAPPAYAPPPPLPVFSWTGFYIGANAGYAFDNRNNVVFTGATGVAAAAGSPSGRSDGFTGGGTIGYNFSTQSLPILNSFAGGFAGGGLVFGVEADAAYTDLHSNTAFAGTGAFSTRTDFVGTVRGRLGLAFDQVLVYGTGGFAYGGIRDSVRFGGAPFFAGARERLQTGYAYGGGIEYALPTATFLNFFNSSAVTIKAEYIHYDLGRESFPVVANTGASFTARNRVDGNLARAGLNFKFGGPAAVPVVARY